MVERARLSVRGEKARIRMELFRALQELGHIEHVTRYVLDPPDGPYRDHAWDHLDTDRFAIVRIIGLVTPIRMDTREAPSLA